MIKNTITKFNPKFHNDNLDAEENFCNQLKEVLKNDYLSEEYYQYLELKLATIKTSVEKEYAEMFLIDFQDKRNHPDENVATKNYHNSFKDDYCDRLEELIKEIETEMKQLEDDFDKKDKEMRELKVV